MFSWFSGQKYLAWAYTDEKPKEDEDIKTHIRRENLELANALAVLGISPSTFHALESKGKMSQIQNLLETALLAKSVEKNEADLNGSIVHESFQFIYKKYVEDSSTNANFLTMDDIRRKNEERKKRRSKSQTADNKEVEMDPKLKERRSR